MHKVDRAWIILDYWINVRILNRYAVENTGYNLGTD